MSRTRSSSARSATAPKAGTADRPGTLPTAAAALLQAGQERLRPLLSALAERNAKLSTPL